MNKMGIKSELKITIVENNMKKLGILALAGVFAMVLSACGERPAKPEVTQEGVEQTTTTTETKPAEEAAAPAVEETKAPEVAAPADEVKPK
jgi:hypothetical protein